MKRFIPSLAACILMVAFVVWRTVVWQSDQSEFDLDRLGRLPAEFSGRVQPLDTIARASLRSIGNSDPRDAHGERLLPIEWLAEVLFQPEQAALNSWIRVGNEDFRATVRRAFQIRSEPPDSLWQSLVGQSSGASSVPRAALSRYASRIDREADALTGAIPAPEPVRLRDAIAAYDALAQSGRPDIEGSFFAEIERLRALAERGRAAVVERQSGNPYSESDYNEMMDLWSDHQELTQLASVKLIPTPDSGGSPRWLSVHSWLAQSISDEAPGGLFTHFARLGDAYRAGDAETFNAVLSTIEAEIDEIAPSAAREARAEAFFNRLNPFLAAKGGYAAAFLLAITSWLHWSLPLRLAGRWLAGMSIFLHSVGLGFQFLILGYEATPTIYASTVFVGWAAASFGFILSFSTRSRLGIASASVAGFGFLWNRLSQGPLVEVVANAAAPTGLFWQATRELSLGLAYASLILAGTLSFLFIMQSFFRGKCEPVHAAELEALLYYLAAAAFITSIVAGLCGGIWTDREYGRFWAWDTFECRMLVMALWSAIYLQGRWAGYFGGRNLIALALIGSIVAIWSWSGTPPIEEAAAAVERASPPGIISTIALIAALCAVMPLRLWDGLKMAPRPVDVSTP